jgi:hypothetical protein
MTKRIKNDRQQYQTRSDIGQGVLKEEKGTPQKNNERKNFIVDQSGYFVWNSDDES